jgi:hypothetical protein
MFVLGLGVFGLGEVGCRRGAKKDDKNFWNTKYEESLATHSPLFPPANR